MIERSVIGLRSRIGRGTVVRDTVVNGADRYETEAERKENRESRNRPDIGIGEGCVIERAIVDKDSRIGNKVRLVNQRNIEEEDTPLYSIREDLRAPLDPADQPIDLTGPVEPVVATGPTRVIDVSQEPAAEVRRTRRPWCLRRILDGDEARLLQPPEGDVDLAGVQRLAERAERVVHPSAQLVAL